jgi:hypothetical protein
VGYDKNKVIEVATSQIGYHEKASGSNLDSNTGNSGSANWTKYARDLDALSGFYNGRKNGFAWCDVFVDWCFVTAYGREAAQFLLCQPNNSAGAGCQYSAQYFNAKGQFHKSGPQTGDQIFFGSAWNNVWHTGLVVAVSENYVTTIEGNTSDQVAKRTYRLNDPNIFGYGRPRWSASDESSGSDSTNNTAEEKTTQKPAETAYMYNVQLPLLRIGDKDGHVKAAQALLIARGYSCGGRRFLGRENPDGEFGRATEKAVADFQRESGLEVDGEIGGATWAALINFN